MTEEERAAATTAWMNEYRNVGGGPWLGRAAMTAAKESRVEDLEDDLKTEHDANGHGPFVINYQVGTGPISAVSHNFDISDARQGELRTRRCICGDEFASDDDVEIADDRTFDGFTRDLRETPWPGNWFEAPQLPTQPRDTAAIRGITDLMPNMIEGVRP